MRDKIRDIVISALNEINQTLETKIAFDKESEYHLFGKNGILDSISLVTLIVAVEQGIENEFDVSIILADEKAMSQRRSPFASINTLVDYTESLVKAEVNQYA